MWFCRGGNIMFSVKHCGNSCGVQGVLDQILTKILPLGNGLCLVLKSMLRLSCVITWKLVYNGQSVFPLSQNKLLFSIQNRACSRLSTHMPLLQHLNDLSVQGRIERRPFAITKAICCLSAFYVYIDREIWLFFSPTSQVILKSTLHFIPFHVFLWNVLLCTLVKFYATSSDLFMLPELTFAVLPLKGFQHEYFHPYLFPIDAQNMFWVLRDPSFSLQNLLLQTAFKG